MAIAIREPTLLKYPEQITIKLNKKEAEKLCFALEWTDFPSLVDLRVQLCNLGYGED